MKDIFLNLFMFQALTSDKFPVRPSSKEIRVVIFTAIFVALFTVQVFYQLKDREPNYFEDLGLNSTQVSLDDIVDNYKHLNDKYNPATNPDKENLVRFKRIQEAYDCLKVFQCRIQYKKFGSYISALSSSTSEVGSGGDPIAKTDWRIASALVFYFTYALLGAAMSTIEQKNGLRYSLALAVVFCLNEVQWLSDANREHLEEKPKQSLLNLQQMFPPTYCLFEKIQIMHLVYFLCYNIICMISKTFGIDEHKDKIKKVNEVVEHQAIIEKELREIYKEEKGEDFSYLPYKKEMKAAKLKRIRELNLRVTAISLGKDPDQFVQQTMVQGNRGQAAGVKARKYVIGAVALYMLYRKFAK